MKLSPEIIARRVLEKAVQKQYYLKFLLAVRQFEKYRRLCKANKLQPKMAEYAMLEIANKAERYLILAGKGKS